ncbi:MAG: endonuclease/exonuclease/phosphatase family protein, partial [Deltaproteobacteria bacterium]|nr:endonuclease/exonuclease/phosphatase family protein [Deltaproteobacteria bacterium]
ITGTTSEYYNRTQLAATSIAVTGYGAVPPFADLTTAQLCQTCAEAESYEGVLVRISDVQITNPDLGYGEYSVAPLGGGAEVRIDDLFGGWFSYQHGASDTYSYVSGVFDYAYDSYKIEPRGCADLIDANGDPYCPVLNCPSEPVDIARVHDVSRLDAVAEGCQVRVREAVMTTSMRVQPDGSANGWLQQGTALHGGIRLYSPGGNVSGLVAGTRVEVFGQVAGIPGSRVLIMRSAQVLGAGTIPDPIAVSAALAGGHVSGTAGHEGMLVQILDPVTVAPRAELESGVDLGMFEIALASAPADRAVVHDLFEVGFACAWPRLEERCATDQRAFGQHFSSITGVLAWNGRYYLLPRTAADLVLAPCDAADADCDGTATTSDACPALFDPAQSNVDGDSFGDACDVCIAVPQSGTDDADGDGVGDACDLCPATPDPGQENLDGDLLGDACDLDRDGDDIEEGDGTAPCRGGETDGCQDNCPFLANPDQEDADADGRGDACQGGRAAIALDGLFGDWVSITAIHVDKRGDRGPGGLDLGGLWLADDGERFYLRIDLGAEIQLQDNNALRIYLDTDDNPASGQAVAGIGAELEWRLGSRQALVTTASGTTQHNWAAMGAIGLPTVSSSQVELALALDARPDGIRPLFSGTHLRVVIQDGADGDQLPDGAGGVAYQLGLGAPVAPPAVDLSRQIAQDLRIASFNVLVDNPWVSGNAQHFQRLLAATVPDVVVLQEIYSHSAQEAIAMVGSALGGTWFAGKYADAVTVSRLPILASWEIPFNTLLLLLDATDQLGGPIAVVDVHLPCCDQVVDRRYAIDLILQSWRRLSRETTEIPVGTPIVLAGDFNLVGVAQERDALIAGDLYTEALFGPDFAPDPAGGPFVSLMSYVAATRLGITYRGDASYGPGFLDYVLYTSSLLEVGNHFVLDTAALADDQLTALGLQRDDSSISDHLLRVTDLRPAP